MSRVFRDHPILLPVLLGILGVVSSACRAKPAMAQPPQPEEHVSGCVSNDHTFRDFLDACTRDYGTKFVLLDDVERDLDRMSFTMISCFIPVGTKASDLQLDANIEMVQQWVLRARSKEDLDLMIDREPLPGTTNTYRIYRLPRDAQTPWNDGATRR